MKNLILTLIIFLFFSIAKGEIVEKIEINGNKRVSEETVKLYGDIETKKDYQDKDLNDIVNKLYSTDFFEDVQVELSNNILKINLKEYPIINQLVIIGEKSNRYTEEIKKQIKEHQELWFHRFRTPCYKSLLDNLLVHIRVLDERFNLLSIIICRRLCRRFQKE